jgi:polar amino acid transport system substrate-binding protein
VVLFERYPEAIQALQEGKVDAVTTDDAILTGLLARMPDKSKYEVSRLQLEVEPYGLGIRKGDKNFVDFVNQTLVEMEKSGEAKKIFTKWFGPNTDFPITRNFKITLGM